MFSYSYLSFRVMKSGGVVSPPPGLVYSPQKNSSSTFFNHPQEMGAIAQSGGDARSSSVS